MIIDCQGILQLISRKFSLDFLSDQIIKSKKIIATNNDHAGIILSRICQINDASDKITLIAGIGNERFPIHRVVLMANSEYFRALLGPNFEEGARTEFVLDGTDSPTLEAIVDFCYTGHIDLTDGNAMKFLTISNGVALDLREQNCWTHFSNELALSNAIETWNIADKYSSHESSHRLHHKAFSLICESFDQLPPSHTDGLDYRLLKKILKSDANHSEEQNILERLLGCLRENEVERGQHMPELLQVIRLTFIPGQYLNSDKIQMIYRRFDCYDYLFAEYKRRITCLTPTAGIRRRRSIYCLFKQFKGENGAELSAVQIERYSCALNKFEEASAIAVGDRVYFAVTLVNDKVYILGGVTRDVYHNYVKAVDLITKKEEDLPEMNYARSSFSSIVIGKYIYVFGGRSSSNTTLNSCERFDLESRTWTILKPMNVARCWTSVAESNGKIYVAGGRNSSNARVNVVESYDPSNNNWVQVAPMSEGRSSFLLFNSGMFVYAIGLKLFVERYDALENSWTRVGSFNKCEDATSSVETDDGVFIMKKTSEFGRCEVDGTGGCSFRQREREREREKAES